ncbi:MAG: hypothetical protein IT364_00590 [Candidatus Hydrogenedentes bacterium]|nr:hypothetical protein [Candidatus Hydrogenedentota bacterium]
MSPSQAAAQETRKEGLLRPQTVTLGDVPVSRFILGANPIGGYAHQTRERDEEMRNWYTMDRVKECYRLAEAAGVTAHLARADDFVMRALREHRNEGGSLTWIAQTCPGVGSIMHGVTNAIHGHARCCFVHGGELDYRVANGKTEEVFDAIRAIKDNGMAAGVAGHNTATIRWAAEHLELDFFMTCYYNPDDRTRQAHRDYETKEYYGPEHREAMCALIQELPAPAIHYKVLAAGRNDPREAFEYVADAYRPGDAVCVGVFTKDNPDMIQVDITLLETALRKRGK